MGRQNSTGRQTIFKIFGIVFIIGAVYIAVCGIYNYKQQLEQRDWRVVMATVTDVSQYKKSTGGVKRNRSKTVYDITYEYNFNSDSYTGKIIGTVIRREINDRFDVKCDPNSPEISTTILEPQPDALIANLFGACIFGTIGSWATGLLSYLSRLKKRISPGKS